MTKHYFLQYVPHQPDICRYRPYFVIGNKEKHGDTASKIVYNFNQGIKDFEEKKFSLEAKRFHLTSSSCYTRNQ